MLIEVDEMSKVVVCRICGVELAPANRNPSSIRWNKKICKICERKEAKDFRRKHNVRTSGGRSLWGNKQPKPENNRCEICGREGRLYYHHFDDQNLMRGMWICTLCHHGAHFVEDKLVEKYEKLKRERF